MLTNVCDQMGSTNISHLEVEMARPARRAMLPSRTNRTLKIKKRANEVRSDIFRKMAVTEDTMSAMPM